MVVNTWKRRILKRSAASDRLPTEYGNLNNNIALVGHVVGGFGGKVGYV